MIYYISEFNYGNTAASSPTFTSKHLYDYPSINKGMVYHTCDDCGEENYFDCYDQKTEPVVKYVETDNQHRKLVDKIKQKIMDLQKQIIIAYTDKTSNIANNPNDVLRYTAMVEALEAMIN